MDKAGGPRKRNLGSRWVTGRVRLQRRREIVGGMLKIFTPRKENELKDRQNYGLE